MNSANTDVGNASTLCPYPDQYKAEEAKAKSEGNSSKARRMGRIVTQYQVGTVVKQGAIVPRPEAWAGL